MLQKKKKIPQEICNGASEKTRDIFKTVTSFLNKSIIVL